MLGVRDSRCYPKSSVERKRPVVLSEKFCRLKKTHGHGYHIDFVLCDRSRD